MRSMTPIDPLVANVPPYSEFSKSCLYNLARLRGELRMNPQIKQNVFSENQHVLIDNKWEVSYRLLLEAEKAAASRRSVLWISEGSPFDYDFRYPQRVAQAFLGALVLDYSKEINLQILGNFGKVTMLRAKEDKFFELICKIGKSSIQTLFLHFEERYWPFSEEEKNELIESLVKAKKNDCEIFIGLEPITNQPKDLISELEGVLL